MGLCRAFMIEVGEISSFHLLDEMYVEQKTLQIFVPFFFFRTSNNSFLRRGATSHSSLRSKQASSQVNLWCPSLQKYTMIPQNLSHPGTPIKSPHYNMPRCRSENLMEDKQRLSPSKPILMTSSAERLPTIPSATESFGKPTNNTRHVSWGAAASTIRATYRLSHGRPRTAPPTPAALPSSPIIHRQNSRTVMP